MHRTQLLRLCDKVESVDRMLAASRDQQHPDQEHEPPRATENGDDKELKPQVSLRAYWLLKNMKSLDGLPGLLTAPDAILSMTPQSHFDKDSPRPTLRPNTGVAGAARDRKWFVSGFVLGTVTVFVITRLVETCLGFLY